MPGLGKYWPFVTEAFTLMLQFAILVRTLNTLIEGVKTISRGVQQILESLRVLRAVGGRGEGREDVDEEAGPEDMC